MSARHDNPARHDGVPPAALLAAGLLLSVALAGVTVARMTQTGLSQKEASSVAGFRDVNFRDRADGGIDVLDAATGRVIDDVQPGTNGFLRGTLRGLARSRRLAGVGAEPPFRLTRWWDGTFSLEDRGTGQIIPLDAFGPTNAAVFVRLLTAGGQQK